MYEKDGFKKYLFFNIKYLYEYRSFGVIIGYEIKTLYFINLRVNSL